MSLDREVELIRGVPIFASIEPAMQKLLCFTSERVSYAPGEVMFRAGDPTDAAFIVIEGTVEITVAAAGGAQVVNKLGRNDVIGEIGVMADLPRTATATAATRVEVLRIAKELFCNVVRESPAAALQLAHLLARRLANTTGKLTRSASG